MPSCRACLRAHRYPQITKQQSWLILGSRARSCADTHPPLPLPLPLPLLPLILALLVAALARPTAAPQMVAAMVMQSGAR